MWVSSVLAQGHGAETCDGFLEGIADRIFCGRVHPWQLGVWVSDGADSRDQTRTGIALDTTTNIEHLWGQWVCWISHGNTMVTQPAEDERVLTFHESIQIPSHISPWLLRWQPTLLEQTLNSMGSLLESHTKCVSLPLRIAERLGSDAKQMQQPCYPAILKQCKLKSEAWTSTTFSMLVSMWSVLNKGSELLCG